jgi:uncharacterized phage-associated protein
MGDIIYFKNEKGRMNMKTKQKKKRRTRSEALTSIFDVASAFLSFGEMGHKKLQKMCYYAYALSYAYSKGEIVLFNDKFEAWIHGPVCPKLYDEYRDYRMYGRIEKEKCPSSIKENDFLNKFINAVYNQYKDYTGDDLERMTHQELPWQNARKGYEEYEYCNVVIDDEDIIRCYGEEDATF